MPIEYVVKRVLQLLLADQSKTAATGFHEGLRDARLDQLMRDDLFARAFALAYVGPERQLPPTETIKMASRSARIQGRGTRRAGEPRRP